MKRYKAEVTFTITYEINPEFYPEGYTPEECLAKDVKEFEASPEEATMYDDIEVKGRIIDVIA